MDAANHTRAEAEKAVDRHIAERTALARQLGNDSRNEERWAKWRAESGEAISRSNSWYEKNGHPLAAYMIEPGDPLSR